MPEEKREVEIFERLIRIETILQNIQDMQSNFVSKEKYDGLENRVGKLENSNTWLVRTVGAIIIGGIMAGVMISSKM